jgi:carboxymethylenebutenolidase
MTALFTIGVPDSGTRLDRPAGPVWTFRPRSRPAGAVLLLHHRDGLDECTADVVGRLLRHGLAVAVPDLFAGQPPGLTPSERKSRIRDDEVLPLMAQAADLLTGYELPVAALGFCMGGRLAFLAGVAIPVVSRVCSVYGGDIDKAWGGTVSPLDRVRADAASTQLHRGSRDSNATDAQAGKAVAAFERTGAYLEACVYAGARHAFANPFAGERYHPAAARRLWTTMFSFLVPDEVFAHAGEASS